MNDYSSTQIVSSPVLLTTFLRSRRLESRRSLLTKILSPRGIVKNVVSPAIVIFVSFRLSDSLSLNLSITKISHQIDRLDILVQY
jgi:hypothetical protein